MSRPYEPEPPAGAPWANGSRPTYGTNRGYGDPVTDEGTGDGSYGAGYRPSQGSYSSSTRYASTYSTGATSVADRPEDAEAEYADDAYTEYPDEGYYEYDEPIDRRWIWVAGIAGAILLVAVICTVVILGGGDSGPVTATVTPSAPTTSAAAPTTPSAVLPTRVAPSPVPPTAALAPETVTTVTPSPTPTAAATPTEVAPPLAAAPTAAAGPTVIYQVTGNRQLLDLVTVIYTDGQGALQSDVNVALPWTKSITLNPGVSLSSVTATSVGAQLNCAITDGSGTPLAAQNNNAMIASCTK
ncbi:MAG: hypothetical protein WCE30_13630 [Mycobacterium sp.]